MVYTKTTWTSTTAITSELLNNAETQYDEAYTVYSVHNHDSSHYLKSQSDSIFWNSDNDGHGSGCDADLLYHPSGNKHASDLIAGGVPSGLIILWSGQNVPSGWALCDGSNGTPDLRNRFVIGAGGDHSPGQIGRPTPAGTQEYQIKPTATVTIGSHSLTIQEIAHSHSYNDYTASGDTMGGATGSQVSYNTYIERDTGYAGNPAGPAEGHTHSASFAGNDCDVRPPYYILAYIMKL